ncbi:hypothetical protein QJS10_CPA06g01606 [Acorus calamus]|uniref:Exocyst component Exo84 C-terminal domain-containing protein n=1 Tax=Acorus calamus TaxID=4465 RepID=A0AAV9EPA2_ACOCL|nr:hypothetical protein QJS10_CPA06g01606 [Acorus calamus]
MSSGRSSRSRAAAPPIGSAVVANGEEAIQLGDKLKVFRAEGFDPDGYVQSKCLTMDEKEIRHLCSYLQDLKKASAEEMRKSVYANYAAFIRTSKEISDLEGELLSIRNLLSTQAALIHGLAEGVNVESLSNASEGSMECEIYDVEDKELSDIQKWAMEFPDVLDVLLAERRVDEALTALDEGDQLATEAEERHTLNAAELSALQTVIIYYRQKLADQLAEAACQPSTCGVELRAAAFSLKRLGDAPQAHILLLNAHYKKYQSSMQNIRPSNTSYGGAYTASLSQIVFSAIAQAARDSEAVFGEESAYKSELLVWSIRQTEAFAQLVKRNALASSAAAGGLRAAAECVQIALSHCSLLEEWGLTLCPVILKLFMPSVEQALDANLKRIEESTAALAAADDWVLTYAPAGTRPSGRSSNVHLSSGTAFQPKLSSSAHRFYSMVQEFFEDVGPFVTMQLGGRTLDGLLQVFKSYINLLINALPNSMEDGENLEGSGNKIVKMAETETQQIALLANASLLADELLPRAAMKLAPMYQVSNKDDARKRASDRQNRLPEQREWKRKLQRSVDGLRDIFCRQHALDLIFTEDGDSNLTADMYINMDGNISEPEWAPSLIFQELFAKLNRIASIAADMFVGRERFATLLLMRLTETVIIWLSEDQSFWEDIEEGSRMLGPFGLQQGGLEINPTVHARWGAGSMISVVDVLRATRKVE